MTTNKKTDKEFKLSSWAIANSSTMYVTIFLILVLGISAYFSMPREDFPEIKETKIYISTLYQEILRKILRSSSPIHWKTN